MNEIASGRRRRIDTKQRSELRLEALEPRTLLAGPSLPLTDNFNRPDSSTISDVWVEPTGNFVVQNGAVRQIGDGTSWALLDGFAAQDVRLEATVNVPSTGVHDAGFVTRHGAECYLGTLVGRDGNFTAEIWKSEDHRWVNLRIVPAAAGSGRLRFEVDGTVLRLFLNDQLLAEVQDAAIQAAGTVGIRSSGSASFDDLTIARLHTIDINHVLEDTNLLKLYWSKLDDRPHTVTITNNDTNAEVLRTVTDKTALELRLPFGSYTARVSASDEPGASHEFTISQPAGERDYIYLGPGHAIAYWEAADTPPYLVRVKNSEGRNVVEGWIYGTQIEILGEPDDYTVEVALPSLSPFSISVDVPDFTGKRFTPLSPIGDTDRRELRFSWFAVPGAVAYFFQLRTPDGAIVTSHWAYSNETAATVTPGEYQWRVIPLNRRNEQANRTTWISINVTEAPLPRENLLGIEPDVTVPANLAKLNYPEDAIQALDGTIYIADTISSVIRRVRDGQVELFAGTLEAGYNGDGFRKDVIFNRPTDLALDAEGNLLVLDTYNYLIRKIDVGTGQVTTIAGVPGVQQLPSEGATARGSTIGWSTAMTFDSQGNLYIPLAFIDPYYSVKENRLFYIATDGVFHERSIELPVPEETVGDLLVTDEYVDLLNGTFFARLFNSGARQLAELETGFSGGIFRRTETQTTLVGNHSSVFEFDENLNRTTLSSGFANVISIQGTQDGFLVVDSDRGAITQYDKNGQLIPGRSIGGTAIDGTSAVLAVARYDADTLLFLENQKGYVFAYSLATGRTWIFAGNGRLQVAQVGVQSSQTGFWYPAGLAVDSQRNVYVSENHRIIRIDAQGMTSLFAGDRLGGDTGDGGPATAARFQSIRDIAFDRQDNLYVADTYNNRIRKISPDGLVTTVAGTGLAGPSEFGRPATMTMLNHPHGVLPLEDGSVLISDSWSNAVVRINNDGTLSHVAGVPRVNTYQGNGSFGGDGGLATEAHLNTPTGLASSGGVLYIVDQFNNRVRAIAADGTIQTVWGRGTLGYAADGSLFNFPYDILVADGDLYLTDYGNGLASRLRIA